MPTRAHGLPVLLAAALLPLLTASLRAVRADEPPPKEAPKEAPKDPPKEAPKEAPKESPKEAPPPAEAPKPEPPPATPKPEPAKPEPPKPEPAKPEPAKPEPAAPAPAEAPKPEPKPEEPETVTLAPGPFAVIVELPAAFEPTEAVEIAWRPTTLGGEVEVEEAAPAGPVEANQVLVRLKAPRHEEQVSLSRLDLAVAQANLRRVEEEARFRAQAVRLGLEGAQRDADRAAADLERFLKLERALRLAEALHGLQGAENGYQDALEELAQLEKMYKADDLTEETEDIVLKRTQRELKRSEERLAFQRQRHQWVVELTIPRDQENLEHRARETRLEAERQKAVGEQALAKAEAEVKKAQREVALQAEALARLEADLAALTLRAPRAGRIQPGVLVRGRWQGVEEAQRALRPGQKVRAEQVLLTLYEPADLRVRTQVPEAHLFHVKPGSAGTVAPAAAPDLALPVAVRSISPAGLDGKHETLLSLGAGDPRLLPGLTGTLRLRSRDRADVLSVPAAALWRDGDKTYVHVWAEGRAAARAVKTGATAEGRVELLEGVKAGEKVLAKAPCGSS